MISSRGLKNLRQQPPSALSVLLFYFCHSFGAFRGLSAPCAHNPVSILYRSTAGRYRPVRVADGLITARVDLEGMLARSVLDFE